jgi:hypothetical protein
VSPALHKAWLIAALAGALTLPAWGSVAVASAGAEPLGGTGVTPNAPPAPQRIDFAPGTTSATVTADLVQGVSLAYVLHVAVGQRMFVAVEGDATPALLGPQGSALSSLSSTPGVWQFDLPEVGDYTVLLLGQGPATLTMTVPPLSTARNITLADDGQTLTFQVGQSFLLFLGVNGNWSVTVADPAVVDRIPDVFVIRGAQGLFQARRPGHTLLTATGDPACRQAQPPCATPSRLFSVQIVVQ